MSHWHLVMTIFKERIYVLSGKKYYSGIKKRHLK
jgi:hypothetical protein